MKKKRKNNLKRIKKMMNKNVNTKVDIGNQAPVKNGTMSANFTMSELNNLIAELGNKNDGKSFSLVDGDIVESDNK